MRYWILFWVLLFVCGLIAACSWIKGTSPYMASQVAFRGPLNGNYASANNLVMEFGWVKACMDVTQPIAYPDVVIYECRDVKDDQICHVPCKGTFADTCYENGVISLPGKKLYFPSMRQRFVEYISDQTGTFNAAYLEQCKGEE